MKEFGEYLRNERLSRGVTLEEIERKTRLRRHHLIAIENGEFHKLPEPAYVRMFLRHYAECIGLDKNAVLERYDALRGTQGGAAGAAPAADDGGRAERRRRQLKARRRRLAVQWLIVAGVLVFVVYLQWPNLTALFWSAPSMPDTAPVGGAEAIRGTEAGSSAPAGGKGADAADLAAAPMPQAAHGTGLEGGGTVPSSTVTPDGEGAAAALAAAEATAAGAAVQSAEPAAPPAGQGGQEAEALRALVLAAGNRPVAVPAAAPGDRFTFGVRTLGLSWVELWIDGERRIYRNLDAGEAYTYEVREEVSLRFGRAENVVVALNGVEIGTLGTSVINKRFILDTAQNEPAE